ncbi:MULTISPECIES: orotate phosphoribosyltransferase [unclassified Gemella]|uniref:orotate phosphoribosyltransferase n=1 Tax=unclassified Gemella TaxID=2624949 RepID=UPI001C0594FD|nr:MULTISPECIES: orotate phosphoribosyltransferase [unclassified Gemella]MBU0278432.1 orotate phosphoribosyltransferase [Gemella sp. zg-1178]QWQ38956.1 orotate phosphoribosyltransferase [Gemella sp. zg-570]
MTKNLAQEVAKNLLEIKAVELRPHDYFTWTSGIKSPIYCDNRLTMSYPNVRRNIANGLAQLIKENFSEVTVVAGTATAGIPHAAWVSELLDLPMSYVRDSKKKHGKTNQIEGLVKKNDKVVVVEDLISTGLSSINVVKALEEIGCEVLGVVAIYSYNLPKALAAFKEANVKYFTITNYDLLIEEASKQGYIKEEDKEELVKWRNNL